MAREDLRGAVSSNPPPLVLLVDDDPDTIELYGFALGQEGYRVEVSRDGNDAWEKATTLLPDVVVTDLSLPGMDGCALCREVKRHVGTSTITVIAVTGWAGKGIEREVHEAGFDVSMLKPVAPDALIEEVRKAVAASRALRVRSESVRSRASNLITDSDRLLARGETLKGRIAKWSKK